MYTYIYSYIYTCNCLYLSFWGHADLVPLCRLCILNLSGLSFSKIFCDTVDSRKLEYGLRVIHARSPSFLCFGIRDRSYSNFLASTAEFHCNYHLSCMVQFYTRANLNKTALEQLSPKGPKASTPSTVKPRAPLPKLDPNRPKQHQT